MAKVYRVNILAHTETDLGDDATVLFVLPGGGEVEVWQRGRRATRRTK